MLDIKAYHVDRATHSSPDTARSGTSSHRLDPYMISLFVTGETHVDEALVGTQPPAVHEELVPQRRHQTFLQGEQAINLAYGVEGMEDILVVHTIVTPCF